MDPMPFYLVKIFLKKFPLVENLANASEIVWMIQNESITNYKFKKIYHLRIYDVLAQLLTHIQNFDSNNLWKYLKAIDSVAPTNHVHPKLSDNKKKLHNICDIIKKMHMQKAWKRCINPSVLSKTSKCVYHARQTLP